MFPFRVLLCWAMLSKNISPVYEPCGLLSRYLDFRNSLHLKYPSSFRTMSVTRDVTRLFCWLALLF
jgi:hypothetical protein